VLSIGGQGAVLRPLDFVKNSREKHGKEKRNGREKKIGTRKKRRQGWGCKLGGGTFLVGLKVIDAPCYVSYSWFRHLGSIKKLSGFCWVNPSKNPPQT